MGQITLLCLTLVMTMKAVVAAETECQPPSLDNGFVEQTELGVFIFKCNPGFKLSAPPQVKCMAGKWSHNPVCTASNCDPEQLPDIVNGRKYRVKNMRGRMYRYTCNRGFRLFGPKTVHCSKTGWSLDNDPFCVFTSKGVCEQTELLGEGGMKHGTFKALPKYKGGFYRFECEPGYIMSGNRTVYCDGKQWNGTKPDCVAPDQPPAQPLLTMENPDGETLPAAGDYIRFNCSTEGGVPRPTLRFQVGEEMVEADIEEEESSDESQEHSAVLSLLLEEEHFHQPVLCTAENRATDSPLSSNTININIKRKPSEVSINVTGEARQFEELELACISFQSNPPAEISVSVLDQDGEEVEVMMREKNPPVRMDSGGWANKLEFSVLPTNNTEELQISCSASNSAGQLSETSRLEVTGPPTELVISGPESQLVGGDSVLSCHLETNGYTVASLAWMVGDTELAMVEELEEVEGVSRSELKLSDFLTERGEVGVWCLATLTVPDISLTSDTLAVTLIDQPEALLSGPSTVAAGEVRLYTCSSPGLGEVAWQVTGQDGASIEQQLPTTTQTRDGVESALEVSGDPSHQVITITCTVTNLAGFSSDHITVETVEKPRPVEVSPPEYSLLGLVAPLEFLCSTAQVHPAPSLSWTVRDWEDQQLDHQVGPTETETEGSQLISRLSLVPPFTARSLAVTCRAENTEGYSENTKDVSLSYLSVELSGVEEGDNVTLGSLLSLQCSVENLPGLAGVEWWNDSNLLLEANLTAEEDSSRLLTSLDWPAESLGETVIQCRPIIMEGAGLEMVENPEASVSFNVVEQQEEEEEEEYYEEEDYEYDYDDQYDYSGYEDEASYQEDDEEEDDATRPEALPDQKPHHERTESLDAISPGPRTLTAGFSSGETKRASGVTVLASVLASVCYFAGRQ